MIKVALEALLNQAFVYNRNPHDPSDFIPEHKPLKFTHLLVETNGAQMLYNEETGDVHTDIRRLEIDPKYPHLPFSYSVTQLPRRPISSLQTWMVNLEHYAVRLDYKGPSVPLKVDTLIEHLKKDRSLTETLEVVISTDTPDGEKLFVTYKNYSVNEVRYDPFTDQIDLEGRVVIEANADAELNYQRFAKHLAKQQHRMFGRSYFVPQVTQSNPSDYIQTPVQEDDGA